MAAYLDRSQDIGFYFGNANKDLAHMLPPEDARAINEITVESLSLRADSILETLGQLERKNAELSFFVSDLLKLLK